MKNFYYLLTFSSFLISCEEIDTKDQFANNTSIGEKTISNQVSLTDIKSVVGLSEYNKTRSVKTGEFDYVIGEAGDTLFFVFNRADGGWEMYSSDKRVPAVVAGCDEGTFEEQMKNPLALDWVKGMAEDMKAIREARDEELLFSKEEIKSNQDFWLSFTDPSRLFELQSTSTRASIPDPVEYPGHYELYDSYSYDEYYDSVDHLTETEWHQGPPFNDYCPLRTDSAGLRAPAGCVAISAAQMLYFLHNKLGVPQSAPSNAYCYGYVNNYESWQGNFSTSVWNYMAEYNYYAAPLVANVGTLLQINYGNSGSSSNNSYLPGRVFSAYGISCSFGGYNESTLVSSLESGMPVILGSRYGSDGHSFIVDGYYRLRNVNVNHYVWVFDEENSSSSTRAFRPNIEDRYTYQYCSPRITRVKMNWGWAYGINDTNYNNVWYTLIGDWHVNIDSRDYYFNTHRDMVYNFNTL